jgi:ATP-binding cassette subfamily F protein 3
MDEPTNHLDLASRTALEEMLSEFSGALLCISHDRAFLDELCNHIFVVSPDGVRVIEGNYTRWRAVCVEEREQREEQRARDTARDRRKQTAPPPKRQKRKARNPYKLARLEARIIELEEKLVELNAELGLERIYRDAALMKEHQIAIAEIEHELSEANEEWENWA